MNGEARIGFYDSLLRKLPSVAEPKTHLSFKSRIKWTALILIFFLILSQISLYAVAPAAYEQFSIYEMILGSRMGTLLTLGIGPIVVASILLQLLVGSGIIPWDLKSAAGRARFQGTQKLLTIIFCFFEAWAFVSFGAVPVATHVDATGAFVDPSAPGAIPLDSFQVQMLTAFLIIQIAFGGFLVLLMDEVVSKWGIGSGVSLFIAAGVTKTIFVRAFNPFVPAGLDVPAGHVPAFIVFLQRADIYQALLQLLPIISTIIVFLAVVYIQAIRVDIPLAFTSIRGFGRRWPLKFIYTSNIPVILTAALFANLIIFGNMLASRGFPILGEFKDNRPQNGFLFYISEPHSTSVQVFSLILLVFIFVGAFAIFWFKLRNWKPILIGSIVFGVAAAFLITFWTVGLPTTTEWAQLAGHLTFYAIFCMLFSILWIATSGMDPKSVAEQIESLGMQIPGFRRDTRIVEDVLSRYIPVLAVLGGLTVGLLASVADLTGAMGTGTGILLTVMIIYNFYEIIATRYVEELHPSLRGLFR